MTEEQLQYAADNKLSIVFTGKTVRYIDKDFKVVGPCMEIPHFEAIDYPEYGKTVWKKARSHIVILFGRLFYNWGNNTTHLGFANKQISHFDCKMFEIYDIHNLNAVNEIL